VVSHTPWSLVKVMQRMKRQYPSLMDKLKTAHACPSVDSGNPADCAFGGEGCMSESQIKEAIEDS